MKTEIFTETLAKLYEDQGYYAEALKQYTALNRENPSIDLEDAVQRMQRKLEVSDTESRRREAEKLAEKWIRLLLMRRGLKRAEKVCGKLCR